MSSEDEIAIRKLHSKTAKLFLRRSSSTTGIGDLFSKNLNLREARSDAGNVEDVKSVSSNEEEPNLNYESPYKKDAISDDTKCIETEDMLMNRPVSISYSVLNFQGKKYTLNDIAHKWKKDCRIWLWKNNKQFKKNRSVGEVKP
ncbi:unnamed protein product [Brassicogethes aeneus]|uniref:Uncharacterized protein n=1 Tax=Brassicogethes aeneus TaxID=1431903 RepID=A0A9P0FC75_BRAAE|nr:unnamed protein product [Brassicogethes aeneus]